MPQVVTRAQATALGKLRYFTGLTCKYGHVCERQTNNGTCIECRVAANKIWMSENSVERKEKEKKYKRENIDRIREVKRAHRHANPEKTREGDRRRALRIIDHIRARNIQYQKDNPDKVRARNARRRASQQGAGGKFTDRDLMAIFESQSGLCAYCFGELGHDYHADHITPVSKGGTSWPENIQLCCPTCNISKGAKDHSEFMRYLGRSV